MSKKAGKSGRGGETVSVRRNRDGRVSMTSRGAGAPDLRKIAPALMAVVQPGALRDRAAAISADVRASGAQRPQVVLVVDGSRPFRAGHDDGRGAGIDPPLDHPVSSMSDSADLVVALSIGDLDAIERVMTPGPWETTPDCPIGIHVGGESLLTVDDEGLGCVYRPADGVGIAAARNAIPVLLRIARAALKLEQGRRCLDSTLSSRQAREFDGDHDAWNDEISDANRLVAQLEDAYRAALSGVRL